MPEQAKPNNNYNDEIDIVELVTSLWKEKIIIIVSTLIAGAIGIYYAFTLTPIYIISAQLKLPEPAELGQFQTAVNLQQQETSFIYTPDAPLRQQQELLSLIANNAPTPTPNTTPDLAMSPQKAFASFLNTLVSNSHITDLAKNNEQLVLKALNVKINDNLLTSIKAQRSIELPNTTKKTNDLAPDSYTLTLTGIERNALKPLLTVDLESASKKTTKAIKSFYINQLTQLIAQETHKQQFKLDTLVDKITARKAYLLAGRLDHIAELKEASKIAAALNIHNPTNIPLLSLSDNKIGLGVELNTPTPLYLRGTKLLNAEISNLESLGERNFFDDDLRSMQAQKLLISNNRRIKQLESEKERLSKNTNTLGFYNNTFDIPINPIKPKKRKIAIMSIFLGGIMGLFIVIIKITWNKFSKAKPSKA